MKKHVHKLAANDEGYTGVRKPRRKKKGQEKPPRQWFIEVAGDDNPDGRKKTVTKAKLSAIGLRTTPLQDFVVHPPNSKLDSATILSVGRALAQAAKKIKTPGDTIYVASAINGLDQLVTRLQETQTEAGQTGELERKALQNPNQLRSQISSARGKLKHLCKGRPEDARTHLETDVSKQRKLLNQFANDHADDHGHLEKLHRNRRTARQNFTKSQQDKRPAYYLKKAKKLLTIAHQIRPSLSDTVYAGYMYRERTLRQAEARLKRYDRLLEDIATAEQMLSKLSRHESEQHRDISIAKYKRIAHGTLLAGFQDAAKAGAKVIFAHAQNIDLALTAEESKIIGTAAKNKPKTKSLSKSPKAVAKRKASQARRSKPEARKNRQATVTQQKKAAQRKVARAKVKAQDNDALRNTIDERKRKKMSADLGLGPKDTSSAEDAPTKPKRKEVTAQTLHICLAATSYSETLLGRKEISAEAREKALQSSPRGKKDNTSEWSDDFKKAVDDRMDELISSGLQGIEAFKQAAAEVRENPPKNVNKPSKDPAFVQAMEENDVVGYAWSIKVNENYRGKDVQLHSYLHKEFALLEALSDCLKQTRIHPHSHIIIHTRSSQIPDLLAAPEKSATARKTLLKNLENRAERNQLESLFIKLDDALAILSEHSCVQVTLEEQKDSPHERRIKGLIDTIQKRIMDSKKRRSKTPPSPAMQPSAYA